MEELYKLHAVTKLQKKNGLIVDCLRTLWDDSMIQTPTTLLAVNLGA